MSNDHLKELLHKQYDEKLALEDLLEFYREKLEEHLDLKHIYTTWIEDAKEKLNATNIEIDYLQREIKD